MSTDALLTATARALVAEGKGILAADESNATMSARLEAVGVDSTPASRLAFRELLLTAPGLGDHISGVILYDETLRQTCADGTPVPQALRDQGVLAGIKVDTGTRPLAGAPGEKVTEGLDGLRERLDEYRELGASFAKWRAILSVDDDRPSAACVRANAHALARYAALCQEAGLVPIVEPEVVMDGDHGLARDEGVTSEVLEVVFAALREQRVLLEGTLLKPSMALPGTASTERPDADEVAAATVRVLRRTVPAAVPGIVFLSGGQSDEAATERLAAIAALGPHPWAVSFSFGRALQSAALAAWGAAASPSETVAAFQRRVHATTAALGAPLVSA